MTLDARKGSTKHSLPIVAELAKGKVTYTLCAVAILFVLLGKTPMRGSLDVGSVEAGYSQGSVVSGAIFQGKPYRQFPGKRVFTKGWEKRVGKKSLDWEKISSKFVRKGGKPSTRTCTKWSVVTTIFSPTEAIHDAANMGDDWCIVIVGDMKTPSDFLTRDPKLKDNDSVFFFDVVEQEAWNRLPGELGEFARSLPFNHFARKNLGFIYAILRGANFIYDFDDDNYIKKGADGKVMSLIPNEKVSFRSRVRVVILGHRIRIRPLFT